MKLNKYTNITNYSALENILNTQKDTTEKGTLFEEFTYYLFKLHPNYQQFTTNIWLYNDIPQSIKISLGLPSKDMGIDLLVESNNEFYAIQCKYRKNRDIVILWKELATFYGLTFGLNNKIKGGFLVTNTYNINNLVASSTKVIPIYGTFFDEWLDEQFFINMRQMILQTAITKRLVVKPRDYQHVIIKKCLEHFKTNDRGYLEMICGSGKTLTSFWINAEMCNKITLVLVPSLYLLSQFYKDWNYMGLDINFILVGSDADVNEIEYHTNGIILTTDPEIIKSKIKNMTVIISTYQSSNKVIIALAGKNIDFCIFDEAHKTVGQVDKQFSLLLSDSIKIKKRLFMTATPKIYDSQNIDNMDDNILSMDNEAYYGKQIYVYNAGTAIKDGFLVDYNIVMMHTDNQYIQKTINDNKYINFEFEESESHYVACALMLLNSQGLHHHLITYHNTVRKTKLFKELLESLISYFKYDIKVLQIDGSYSVSKRSAIIREFINYKNVIMVSAKVLNEGINIPIIDSVCFVDNRTSTIDLIQCIGRSLRLHESKSAANIFVPILCNNLEVLKDCSAYVNLIRILKSLSSIDERIVDYFSGVSNNIANVNNKIKMINYVSDIIISEKININEWSKEIGCIVWQKVDNMNYNYNLILQFVLKNNKLPSYGSKNTLEKKLGQACSRIRQSKKNGTLNQQSIEKYNKIQLWYWSNDIVVKKRSFVENYNDLKVWVNNNNKLPNKRSKDSLEKRLGFFCSKMRANNSKNKINDVEKKLLDIIPFWRWEFDNFDSNFAKLKQFIETNNKMPSHNSENVEDTSLASWYSGIRGMKRKNILDQNRINMFNELPLWAWDVEDTFDENYTKLIEFVEKNDKLPKQHTLDKSENSLAHWITDIRRRKDKLNDMKIAQIEKIKYFYWDDEELFNTKYEELKKFIEDNNRLPIQTNKSNIIETKSNIRRFKGTEKSYACFCVWIRDQKRKDKLSEEKIKMFDELEHWYWDYYEFDDIYNKLITFINNNNRIPITTSIEPEEKYLAKWCSNIRNSKRSNKLPTDQITRFEEISIWYWEKYDFNDFYDKLLKFIDINKTLPITSSLDPSEKYLGMTCSKIRSLKRKNKLPDDKIKLMEKIGLWVWDFYDFNERYEDLKKFIHDNNRYPSYKNEPSLLNWCNSRKRDKKLNILTLDEINKLESLENWTWLKSDTFLIRDDFDGKYIKYLSWVNENKKHPTKSKDKYCDGLAQWATVQRRKYKNNKLDNKQIEKLEKIPNWYWSIEDPFDRRLEELFAFVQKNNRLPSRLSNNKEEKSCSYWLQDRKKQINDEQSDLYKKLSTNSLIKENLNKFLQEKQKV
jgi:superfamily II DNA or RNA helicase/effector-binding domain-containing protein